jgi:hypothetical protein
MEMEHLMTSLPSQTPSAATRITSWFAGFLGLAFFLFIVWFFVCEVVTAGSFPPFLKFSLPEKIETLAFFMILVGCLTGIKWKGWGAGLILFGYTLFHIIEQRLMFSLIIAVPLIVGLLYLILWWKNKPQRSKKMNTA